MRANRIPYAERVLIAAEARSGSRQHAVATRHGVSRSSVQRIAKADRATPEEVPSQGQLPIQRSIQTAGNLTSVCFGDGRVLMTTDKQEIRLQSIARPHMLNELVSGPEVVLSFQNARAVIALRKRLDLILKRMSER